MKGRVRAHVSELISRHSASFTPSERQIANLLLGDPLATGFSSATDLAHHLRISTSTVVRFAQALGFRGWLELQGAIKHESTERQRLVDMAPVEEKFLGAFVNTEVDNLKYMLGQDDELDAAAELLAGAATVWLLGNRASRFAVGMAHHFMNMTRPNVRLLRGDVRVVPDQLLDVGPGQAALVVCISRYAQATLDLTSYLARRMPVVLLTDEFASPLLAQATVSLRFATAGVSSWKSSTGAFSMTQALVMAVARKHRGSRERLNRAEEIWREFGTYTEEER